MPTRKYTLKLPSWKVNRENQSRSIYESPGVDKFELFFMRYCKDIYFVHIEEEV